MNPTMELLVMNLRNEVEELLKQKEFTEKIIKNIVIEMLGKKLRENKISSTEYQEALDILRRCN